jgi:hypothetical protein
MSEFRAIESLSGVFGSGGGKVRLPIESPATQRIAIVRITGTFVGTLKIQSRIAGGAYTDASVFTAGAATNANPTAPGVYAAILLANAVEAQVIFSAYTSGTARVEAVVVPQAP